jgi:ubiquitin-like 1-activating enzyme E1 B
VHEFNYYYNQLINRTDIKEFEKDDKDIIGFVAAAANLRAYCFSIELLSQFKLKEIAGNIVPAIVSTNAITAGV